MSKINFFCTLCNFYGLFNAYEQKKKDRWTSWEINLNQCYCYNQGFRGSHSSWRPVSRHITAGRRHTFTLGPTANWWHSDSSGKAQVLRHRLKIMKVSMILQYDSVDPFLIPRGWISFTLVIPWLPPSGSYGTVKFSTHIHVPLEMNCNNFGDPLTHHHVKLANRRCC